MRIIYLILLIYFYINGILSPLRLPFRHVRVSGFQNAPNEVNSQRRPLLQNLPAHPRSQRRAHSGFSSFPSLSSSSASSAASAAARSSLTWPMNSSAPFLASRRNSLSSLLSRSRSSLRPATE